MWLCFPVSKTCSPALKLQEQAKEASTITITWTLLQATSITTDLEQEGLQRVLAGNDKSNSSLLILTAKAQHLGVVNHWIWLLE